MLEKYEEAIRNILEKSYLAGYDKHPHFIKDYTDQIIEAVKPAIEEAKKEGFEAGKRYFLHTVVVDGMGTAESNNRLLNMNDIRLLPMWHDTWTHDWQVPLAAQDIIGFEAGKMLGRREAAEEIKRELDITLDALEKTANKNTITGRGMRSAVSILRKSLAKTTGRSG